MAPAHEKTIAEHFQDQLIGNALPAWLRTATPEQIDLLRAAMVASLQARERCAALMARLRGVEAFTQPLLRQALMDQLGGLDDRTSSFRVGRKEPVVTSQPIGWPVTQAVYSNVSLLEAALRNFTQDEAQGRQLAGNRLVDSAGRPGDLPSAQRFAGFCRTLDLGGQYQRHLADVLQPAGEAGRQVIALLAEHQRQGLLVDAHSAWIKGTIDRQEHQLLVDLCAGGPALKLRGDPVRTRRLRLLGCTLEQIVVLDARDEDWSPLYTSSRRIIAYIPGDPLVPLRAYPSLRHFANDLGKRLRTTAYQRFFSRFVRRRDGQAFFSAVIGGYAGVSDLANIDLQEHMTDWAAPLFDNLARSRIEQIKDDAAQLATPVAQLDREVQLAHDQRLAAEGWTLLGLAGLFVPGLGLALLGVAAWQLLGEVFDGIEAWHEGDRSAALDHLCRVATDLALLATTATAVTAVRAAWTRATLVDELLPVRLTDGRVRLGQVDLADHPDDTLPAQALRDQAGVWQLAERHWVQLDQRFYAVERQGSGEGWQLVARGGHAPALVGNGSGAWRLWSEQPRQWDRLRLFRRLGISRFYLEDEDIEQVLQAADTQAEHLLATHVQGTPVDALLRDCTQHAVLDGRIRILVASLRGGERVTDTTVLAHAQALPGAQGLTDQALAELAWAQRRALLERLYSSIQDTENTQVAILRRAFPRLPQVLAQALLDTSQAILRQRLETTGRVPLALAEAARDALWRSRVARVYEAFHFDTAQTLDLARVALGLLKHLPGAMGGQAWRLYDGLLATAPLLETAAADDARPLELLHGVDGFQLFDGQGNALTSAPGELFDTLAAGFTDTERDALGVGDPLGHNLRVLLGRLAASDRTRLERLLGRVAAQGWFRPPQRLADGRVGYPLNGRGAGRGRPRALYAMVRALYPLYEDLEIEHWARRVHEAGQHVEAQLARLAAELSTLQATLRDWAGVVGNRAEQGERRHFAEALVRGWQRMGPRIIGDSIEVSGYRLNLLGINLESLPELPESISFAHVRELSFRGMGLRRVPRAFMRAFPGLRVLELSGNRLERLPEGLDGLRELAELDLYDNQIVLDTAQVSMLEQCEHLQYLNLSFNPLGRSFSVRRLGRLRNLNLRAAQLPRLPTALLGRLELVIADLRDNRISSLPERFFQTPLWISSTILLEDNPLEEETALRFELHMRSHWAAGEGAAAAPASARQQWLLALGDNARAEHGEDWDALEAEEGAADFFGLLGRLPGTSDYRQRPAALAERVFVMLRAMRAHTDLREALFEQAQLTLTCQDSVALSFSGLELHLLVWQATVEAGAGGEQAALLHLGRQLWRLEQVERIALADIQARARDGRDADQIEVVLAYRIGLREALDLPAQPDDMAFADIANIDAMQLDQAQAQVLAAENDERLADSLVDREFWQRWLERAHGERFAALDEPYQQRMATLMDQAQGGPGGEGDLLTQADQIRDEQQAARRVLLLELTEHALRERADK
ncbi:NEL-type E3 ubiquitin ligase domain-containing protein [Pseudomonas sp. UFMG81]|uniref:NEL-type E3 ubiquitin ligase domain-containing protein n=1 Tax=Pseudomonas sp. UFMG81 TaxID=2745936 RepID=UPI00188FD8E3|nr:NEL-type E3 ubiquitin ligase domain-containing protein [Pseudomonas sp. UFMG81]